jgi:hypothetical protein
LDRTFWIAVLREPRPIYFRYAAIQSVAISRCASANGTLPSQTSRQSFASSVSL